VCRDRTHVPTCQKVTRCQLSYRGRLSVDSGKGMYLTNDWLYCTIKGIINISCRKREPLSI
ncbi:unnamed protein product, partial [Ascophyllum nodosum]